jgi:hypothetical protein
MCACALDSFVCSVCRLQLLVGFVLFVGGRVLGLFSLVCVGVCVCVCVCALVVVVCWLALWVGLFGWCFDVCAWVCF